MKALEGKPIDRDNPRQGMKIIKEMSDEISKGRNYPFSSGRFSIPVTFIFT